MMAKYVCKDGDMLDDICAAHYGDIGGIVESVLAKNPGLAVLGLVYDAGLVIDLPELSQPTPAQKTRLWD